MTASRIQMSGFANGGWVPRCLASSSVAISASSACPHTFSMWISCENPTVSWSSPDGMALVKAVMAGECDPGILADWCDENEPTSGVFTARMGDILRWSQP